MENQGNRPEGPTQGEPGTQQGGSDQEDPWRARRAHGDPRGPKENQERTKKEEAEANNISASRTRGAHGRDDSYANPKK